MVIGRHEALRTTFDVISGRPVQVVHQESPRILTHLDLSDRPEPEHAAYAAARQAASTPFDLKQGPLLRALLLQLGPEHHILFCILHHIVADGWPLGQFARELAACYTAFREGRRPSLKPLSVQYPDYALWEQEGLETREFQLQLARYARGLASAPAPPFLVGAAEGGTEPSASGTSWAVWLSPDVMSAIRSAALRQEATVFALSLATFQVLLWQLSGLEDQIVGVPAARRNRVEVEDIIGLFTNIVVVRTDLSGNPAVAEVLGRTTPPDDNS
jgi:hypothetical protein